MREYGGVDIYIHIFLSSTLVGGESSASRPCRFTPGETAPGTHWMGTRASLEHMEKRKFLTLPELEVRPLGRPVVIPTELYRFPTMSSTGKAQVWPDPIFKSGQASRHVVPSVCPYRISLSCVWDNTACFQYRPKLNLISRCPRRSKT
jgi:hypothetical protein